MTTLGKIIGGGMPVGAFGGREEIMHHLAPLGPVYQAGTLSGNPVAMAAGLATLKIISNDGFYETLGKKAQRLTNGLQKAATENGIALSHNIVGGMFGLFFTDRNEVSRFEHVMACDAEKFKTFFHQMLSRGVNLAPSAFEAGFISTAHSDQDIDNTVAAASESFAALTN